MTDHVMLISRALDFLIASHFSDLKCRVRWSDRVVSLRRNASCGGVW